MGLECVNIAAARAVAGAVKHLFGVLGRLVVLALAQAANPLRHELATEHPEKFREVGRILSTTCSKIMKFAAEIEREATKPVADLVELAEHSTDRQ